MTPPHLDDEDLSAHLDGADWHPHLSSCEACRRRLTALTAARDAVAAADVAPLGDADVDRMVARALATTGPAGVVSADEDPDVVSAASVVSADRARARRRRTPPPVWVVTAAAAIAALAGVAGLLRAAGPDNSSATLADGRLNLESSDHGGPADEKLPKSATAAGALDPEVVQADLGDQDDPAALAALLADRHGSDASDPDIEAAQARGGGGSSANPPSPTTTMMLGADRARCRAEAERIGAGRFGRLRSTSIVRWKSVSAEVLVFDLTEPSGGVSRQAMVLARSDCALLADPRF